MSRDGTARRHRIAVLLLLGPLAGIAVGLLAHAVSAGSTASTPTLPELHGQASWGNGERRAQPFRLRDQDGAVVSLSKLRGRQVLLTFLDSRCQDQCPVAGHELGTILRDMAPAERPTLVVVSVNPSGDTRASIRHAMAAWRLAGRWRWHWLRGTRAELARVWHRYGVTVEPTTNDITHGLALYLVDRRGFQRTGYLFPFLPNFVQLDLEKLAREKA